jgi:hypothetical protein
MRRLNAVLTVFWIAMVPLAVATGWLYSVAFISAVSIYANIASHLAAWRADVPNQEAHE